MVFLHSNGVSTSRAVRIYKTYGDAAIETVRANPYTLAKDIHGIGFTTADRIAQKIGIPHDSILRACAALDHVLQEATNQGHCALPEQFLKEEAGKLLSVEDGIISTALERTLASQELVRESIGGEDLIFLTALKRAEETIAARIKELCASSANYPPINFEKAVCQCRKKTGKALAPSQREALKQALTRRILVITGGPGVRQNDVGQRHSFDPARQGSALSALRADGPRREAARGNHRPRSQNDSSPARSGAGLGPVFPE